ncbi:MAG: hypothetical protein GYB41_03025 [Oceanospirillales bacterium]|uniref:Uncharacterized protein n=1 Tax=Marinobacterium halophilum TaxID=267374 RepID=A0A2P8F262_9GAMM|nr:hypothetical protein [Marinobacterium halophilum]MBR9827616.1 hypothetical protein [Oceanospirillales bacterium]PSL15786.1 hypothetical protein CLV44_10367 [Marinobacterium halophilum]
MVQSARIPDEHLFRDKLVIRATRKGDGWQLRYVLADQYWGESRGRLVQPSDEGWQIPLQTPKGFKAQLQLEFVGR